MAFSPFALILLPAGYLFLWPLVERLLRDREAEVGPLQVALTALALSVGALTLALFWVGLLPGHWLTGVAALGVVGVGLMAGVALNRDWVAPERWRSWWLAQWRRLARLELDGLLLWTMIGAGTIMLVHALYYPFIGDDVLSRYGLQAQMIYTEHRIPEAVSGYPPLAPLAFVATWLAAGQANEHLARVFPVVMAVGVLGTIYLIGRRIWGREQGLVAATLVALSPMFIRNGTLAYTDIPTTFPLILAVFYTLQWWESGRTQDAALAGALMGIAAFTKQSALTWVASLATIPPLWLLATHRQAVPQRWRRATSGLAAMLLPAALIGGPWYVRNWLIGGWGNVVPIAGLYHLLEPGVGPWGLIPPVAAGNDFGLALAPLYALGWVTGLALAGWQLWKVLSGKLTALPADLIFAVMIVPYWLAWWTRFSFDTRFLLLIQPLMALWAARPLIWALVQVRQHIRLPRLVWQVGGAALLLGLLVWGTRDRLGGVYRAVAYPFASDTERLLHAKGRLYNMVLYVRNHLDPEADRLVLMDGRMTYYLRDFDTHVMYPLRLSDLEGYDYILHSSSIYAVYDSPLGWRDSEFYQHAWDPAYFEPVYMSEGVHIMRILRTE